MSGTLPDAPVIPTSTVSNPATFRSHFPEFADIATYPDASVQFNLDLATAALDPGRWGVMLQGGVELFAAHMLALSRYATVRASGGTAPGMASGPMSSKSVSKVSASYDVNITSIEGGGPWNYTVYGQRFYWMLRLVGIGGYEVLGESAGAVQGAAWAWAMRWSVGVMMGG